MSEKITFEPITVALNTSGSIGVPNRRLDMSNPVDRAISKAIFFESRRCQYTDEEIEFLWNHHISADVFPRIKEDFKGVFDKSKDNP